MKRENTIAVMLKKRAVATGQWKRVNDKLSTIYRPLIVSRKSLQISSNGYESNKYFRKPRLVYVPCCPIFGSLSWSYGSQESIFQLRESFRLYFLSDLLLIMELSQRHRGHGSAQPHLAMERVASLHWPSNSALHSEASAPSRYRRIR